MLIEQCGEKDCPIQPSPSDGGYYEIQVKGELDERWSDWFDNLNVSTGAVGETLIAGSLLDQAALYGVLLKIRDLGLVLLSVNRVEREK